MAPPSRVDDAEPSAASATPTVSIDLAPQRVAADGIEVETARNEATGLTVTEIVTSGSGEVIIQIPLERVLDRVAHLIEQQQRTNEQ